MVSIYKKENERTVVVQGEQITYITVEMRGTSQDQIPETIGDKAVDNGSVFIEMDTGKIYMYSFDDGGSWLEFGGENG